MYFDFNKGYDDDGSVKFQRKPLIAISANIIEQNSALHFAYSQSIINAGGIPIIVPVNCDGGAMVSLMESVDALLLSGGADIDARYFNEDNIPDLTEIVPERDYNEFMLLRCAIDRSIPIFGICRGCQLINVALGGTLYQDLPSQYGGELLPHSILTDRHLPVHSVTVAEGSQLHYVLGSSRIEVNSRHHQAIKDIAPSLRVTALADDGVIEAIDGYPISKILAVQWHPENMATDGKNETMKKLFDFFVSEAYLYRRAKDIHLCNLIIDSHCDTPMLYDSAGFDLSVRNSKAKVDIIKMEQGCVDTTITVAYTPQSITKEVATKRAVSILERFKADLAKNSDRVVFANDANAIISAKQHGMRSVMVALENGLAIGDDIDNIDMFAKMGVVYITLCHNGSNDICESAVRRGTVDGVSEFGAMVIKRMNSLGVTVDVSHSSEKSTFDALRLSQQPIIASHSSCKALCYHPRNLSDEAIIAIAKQGGVVQVCGYGGFLTKKSKANIFDLIAHIEHIVALTGYDNVGVGSDFDGDGGVEGFDGANQFANLTIELLRRGHKTQDIAKIMGANIFRVISKNLTIKG